MDVIITIVLLALGLVIVGILTNMAQDIIDAAGLQIHKVTGSSTTAILGGGGGGGGAMGGR